MSELKRCFVIAPIGSEGSATRRRSDQVLKHIIRAAAEECGYTDVIRADKISEPGLITAQILEHIIEDEIVIADLTEHNPNVFYELAIRHASRKPFVQLIEQGEKIPFDLTGWRTIHVNHQDMDSVEAARTELCNQIRSAEQRPDEFPSPISMSMNLGVLSRSSDPEKQSLAQLARAMGEMGSELIALRNNFDILDKLKTWQIVSDRLLSFEKTLEELSRGVDSSGYDIGDVISELASLESKIDALDISGIESRLDALENQLE